MKIIAIIQARMGSTRLPQKMGTNLCGFPVIDWVIRRVAMSQTITDIFLATSDSIDNLFLVERAKKFNIKSFIGDEIDVLSRFESIVSNEKPDIIVRICGDNPLITATEIDRIVNFFISGEYDYAFNHIPSMGNNYIDGIGAEVMSKSTFLKIINKANSINHHEHVTSFIHENLTLFNIGTLIAPKNLSFPNISLDIDTESDLNELRYSLNSYLEYNFFAKPEDLIVEDFIRFIVANKLMNA